MRIDNKKDNHLRRIATYYIYNDSQSLRKQRLLPHNNIYTASKTNGKQTHDTHRIYPQNYIVELLIRHAEEYGYCWTSNLQKADVIFTNDIYSDETMNLNLPRIKRVDGCERGLRQERNVYHIEAINMSDQCIAISEYSKMTYLRNYGGQIDMQNTNKFVVILNWCDSQMFVYIRDSKLQNAHRNFLSIAANWNVVWKRYQTVLDFGSLLNDHETLHIIGQQPEYTYLPHIRRYQAMDHLAIARCLPVCDVLVHPAYCPPCDKVICEAIACQKQVVYSTTGGTQEYTPYIINQSKDNSWGFPIQEDQSYDISGNVPEISKDQLDDVLTRIRQSYAHELQSVYTMCIMLDKYYSVFNHILNKK